jgi:hypothetical protein
MVFQKHQCRDHFEVWAREIAALEIDLAQSRKIQSLFDQQQKRGAAYFMGEM